MNRSIYWTIRLTLVVVLLTVTMYGIHMTHSYGEDSARVGTHSHHELTDQQNIINLKPQPQQSPLWGWQDSQGYIWQNPQNQGQNPSPQPYGYQDGTGNIILFPQPPPSR